MTDRPTFGLVPQAVGLVVALVLTTVVWYPPFLAPLLPDDFVWRNLAQQGIDWAFCLILIAIVLLWEREPLTSLGFKRLTRENLLAGLGLGGFFLLGQFLWNFVAGRFAGADPSLGAGPLPDGFVLWYGPVALVTASFCEEIIYRGYAMERLLRIFKSPWPGIVLPHVAFALMHIKDGWGKVAMVGIVGLLFTLYYYRYRDLTMTIVAHFFIDSLALVGHFAGIRSS